MYGGLIAILTAKDCASDNRFLIRPASPSRTKAFASMKRAAAVMTSYVFTFIVLRGFPIVSRGSYRWRTGAHQQIIQRFCKSPWRHQTRHSWTISWARMTISSWESSRSSLSRNDCQYSGARVRHDLDDAILSHSVSLPLRQSPYGGPERNWSRRRTRRPALSKSFRTSPAKRAVDFRSLW
jgi:hypothetical protein